MAQPPDKRSAVVVIATAMIFALAGCGSDLFDTDYGDTGNGDTGSGEEGEPGDSNAPEWAHDVTTPGEKLTTLELDDVTVDVYQADVVEAAKGIRNPDLEPEDLRIEEGDDIVYVNYVVTNHGDEVNLGASLVSVHAAYDGVEVVNEMPEVDDADQFEKVGVNNYPIDETNGDSVYPFGADEVFSFGQNFAYNKDSDISFEAEMIPVDNNGDDMDNETVEAEADSTIE